MNFATGIIVGMLAASPFCWSASAELTSAAPEDDGAIVAEEGGGVCLRKYLILTSPRSGSTWTCELLHKQKGVSCGKHGKRAHGSKMEMLMEYFKQSEVTWDEYRKSLDEAFAEVCQYNPSYSIGFKVMYHQIPPQFVEGGEFEDYLVDNQISLVHLVREAKILVLSSKKNLAERWKQGFGDVHRTTNTTLAKQIRDSTNKMLWDDLLIDDMLELEAESIEWQVFLHGMTPAVSYHYLNYERLMFETDIYAGQLVRFVTQGRHGGSLTGAADMLQLSAPTCAERVADYVELRAHEKFKHSRSARACDLMEQLAED